MILFEIENVGEFMNCLFIKEWLDFMELIEGEIITFYPIKIDGRRSMEWYDRKEIEERIDTGNIKLSEFITWKECKQQAYQFIKGKKVPQLFQLVLRLPREKMKMIVGNIEDDLLEEEIQGLYLNIKYEKKQLSIITGVSFRKFSMNKSLEKEWDDTVKEILKKYGFYYERKKIQNNPLTF